MTAAAKAAARALAMAMMAPVALSLWLRTPIIGRDRAFRHSTEWLALLPGLLGQYLRRAFLRMTAAGCGPQVVVCSGTTFSSRDVRLDDNVYVGASCNIGWAHIGRDALVATGVHVLSGPATHGFAQLDVPIREQSGTAVMVSVGEGAWLGNGVIVLADVGRHAIVAAGSIVTRPIPAYAVAAGNPARVLRDRRAAPDPGSRATPPPAG